MGLKRMMKELERLLNSIDTEDIEVSNNDDWNEEEYQRWFKWFKNSGDTFIEID